MLAPATAFFKKYQAKAAARASIRSATISAVGLCLDQHAGRGDRRHQERRRRQDRRLPAQDTDQTIMGDWSYGPKGEWTKSGMMQVQYHNVKDGNDLDQWRGMAVQTVLTPAELKTGDVIYPYEKAK